MYKIILKFLLNIYLFYALSCLANLLYNFIKSRLNNPEIRRKNKNKWIVLTGATDGIGKALALNLAKQKFKLIIFGRNETKLKDIEENIKKLGSECITKKMDFSQELTFENFSFLKNYEIGILINNVGCCSDGPTFFIEDKEMTNIINVNIANTFLLTRVVLNSMMQRKFGYVINIGSISGDFPMPFLSTYAASKAMIKSWSESLAIELKPYNINVECMDTGYVATKMSKIRRTSILCPSADVYANNIIRHFGSNSFSFAYLPHLLQYLCMSLLPRSLLGIIVLYYQYQRIKKIEMKNKKNGN